MAINKYENNFIKNSFYFFGYLLEPNIKPENCCQNLVTVKKFKGFFFTLKKNHQMMKICHKKCCLSQVIISLPINRKVFKSKEKGLTNKFWIVEYHMLSSLFGCYDQCWI